jgi:hypothetical protein
MSNRWNSSALESLNRIGRHKGDGDMTSSVVALLAVAGLAFLAVYLATRVLPHSLLWMFLAATWCAAVVAIFVVDVNIPLSESHLYSSGAPAPLWLALCATFVRFATLATIVLARRTMESSFRKPRLQPTTREDATV